MQSEELYYDHYKDSFEQQKKYLETRDKLTLYLIVLVALILLLSNNRSMLVDVSDAWQKMNIGKPVVDFNIISTSLYFVFMWFSLRYYQVNLTIERGYSYLERCEQKLSTNGIFSIDREGGNYGKNYPWLKWLAHRIYVFVFPLLVIFTAVASICHECCNEHSYRSFNIVFLLLVVLLSILYLVDRILGK